MIDINSFGSGAGLVLLGYVCGCVVGIVLRVLNVAREI